MDSTNSSEWIATVASDFEAEMDTIIKRHNSWWNTVETGTERKFGSALNKARVKARQMTRKAGDTKGIELSDVNEFKLYLLEALESIMELREFYYLNDQQANMEIVSLFLSVTELALKQLSLLSPSETDEREIKSSKYYLVRYPFKIPVPTDENALQSVIEKIKEAFSFQFLELVRDVDTAFLIVVNSIGEDAVTFPASLRLHWVYDDMLDFSIDRRFGGSIPLAPANLGDSFMEELIFRRIHADIHRLSVEEYSALIEYCINYQSTRRQEQQLFSLHSDVIADVPQDYLEFDEDVQALAGLIAYRKASLPLAIGLFGAWGTGKSFFMKQLQLKIIENAATDGEAYCKKIVHVHFNSWHYSDANLWASLIHKIFEDLVKDVTVSPNEMARIWQNLHSTKQKVTQLQVKLDLAKDALDIVQQTKSDLENKILEDQLELAHLSNANIVQTVWESELIQTEIQAVKPLIPSQVITDASKLKQAIGELHSVWAKILESLKIVYRFSKGKRPVAFILFIIVLAIVYCSMTFTLATGHFWNWVAGKWAIVAAFISQLPAIGIWFDRVKGAHQKLVMLEQAIDKKTREETESQRLVREKINQAIQQKKNIVIENEQRLAELKIEQAALEAEIIDFDSGAKLLSFLQQKSTDNKYLNSLGLISWIRKDFEELNFLLKIQHELDEQALQKMNRTRADGVIRIDRIVLYIDDLDRCSSEIVVRVLEAIHLLLAFPLFVVVVGVDPRWLHSALQEKYPVLSNPEASGGVLATMSSLDYMEKIFQIPFALKRLSDQNRESFIEKMLEGDVKSAEFVPPPKPKPGGDDPDRKGRLGGKGFGDLLQESSIRDNKATDPSLLQIDAKELALIKSAGRLSGNSPRAIKRFINIYRIVRSHPAFHYEPHLELSYHAAAIVLLGILSSDPTSSKRWTGLISKADDKSLFVDVVSSQLRQPEKDALGVLLIEMIHRQGEDPVFPSMEMNVLKRNIKLLCRFSFHAT